GPIAAGKQHRRAFAPAAAGDGELDRALDHCGWRAAAPGVTQHVGVASRVADRLSDDGIADEVRAMIEDPNRQDAALRAGAAHTDAIVTARSRYSGHRGAVAVHVAC